MITIPASRSTTRPGVSPATHRQPSHPPAARHNTGDPRYQAVIHVNSYVG